MSKWKKRERKYRSNMRKAQYVIKHRNAWRERVNDARQRTFKPVAVPIPNHERLRHRLADQWIPRILRCVLAKRLDLHSRDASYGWCDAFIDVVQDFKAITDAATVARSVVDELGIPVDLLHDPAALRAWLFTPPPPPPERPKRTLSKRPNHRHGRRNRHWEAPRIFGFRPALREFRTHREEMTIL